MCGTVGGGLSRNPKLSATMFLKNWPGVFSVAWQQTLLEGSGFHFGGVGVGN